MGLFGCRHKWRVVDSEPFIDTSYGLRILKTELLYECLNCGWHKVQSVDGHYHHYSPLEIVKYYLKEYIIEHPEEVQEML